MNKSINSNRRPHDQVFSPEVFLVTRKKFDSNIPENPRFLISFFSGIVRVIALSLFSDRAYIYQLFSMDSWLPWDQAISQVLGNISDFLGGLAGPLVTYFAGKYTAGHYGRSTGTAGVTALLVSLIVGSQELLVGPLHDGQLTRINLPATTNIVLAIFLGYLIGQIFRLSKASDDQIVDKDFIYQPKTVRPIFLSLVLGVSLNLLLVLGNQWFLGTNLIFFRLSDSSWLL